MTMVTFTKLLLIRIVARSSLGLLRNSKTILSFLWLLWRSNAMSEGVSEKKAVSDPEIKPDITTRNMSTTIDKRTSSEKPIKN